MFKLCFPAKNFYSSGRVQNSHCPPRCPPKVDEQGWYFSSEPRTCRDLQSESEKVAFEGDNVVLQLALGLPFRFWALIHRTRTLQEGPASAWVLSVQVLKSKDKTILLAVSVDLQHPTKSGQMI